MTKYQVPNSACPSCGVMWTGAASLTDESCPEPGDLSICAHCQAVNLYGPDLRLRAPSADELAAMKADKRWADVQRLQWSLTRAKREGR